MRLNLVVSRVEILPRLIGQSVVLEIESEDGDEPVILRLELTERDAAELSAKLLGEMGPE